MVEISRETFTKYLLFQAEILNLTLTEMEVKDLEIQEQIDQLKVNVDVQGLTILKQHRKIEEQEEKIEEQDGKIKHLLKTEPELTAFKRLLFGRDFEHVFSIDDRLYFYSGTEVSFDKAKQLCSLFQSKVFEPRTSETYNQVKSRLSEVAE